MNVSKLSIEEKFVEIDGHIIQLNDANEFVYDNIEYVACTYYCNFRKYLGAYYEYVDVSKEVAGIISKSSAIEFIEMFSFLFKITDFPVNENYSFSDRLKAMMAKIKYDENEIIPTLLQSMMPYLDEEHLFESFEFMNMPNIKIIGNKLTDVLTTLNSFIAKYLAFDDAILCYKSWRIFYDFVSCLLHILILCDLKFVELNKNQYTLHTLIATLVDLMTDRLTTKIMLDDNGQINPKSGSEFIYNVYREFPILKNIRSQNDLVKITKPMDIVQQAHGMFVFYFNFPTATRIELTLNHYLQSVPHLKSRITVPLITSILHDLADPKQVWYDQDSIVEVFAKYDLQTKLREFQEMSHQSS